MTHFACDGFPCLYRETVATEVFRSSILFHKIHVSLEATPDIFAFDLALKQHQQNFSHFQPSSVLAHYLCWSYLKMIKRRKHEPTSNPEPQIFDLCHHISVVQNLLRKDKPGVWLLFTSFERVKCLRTLLKGSQVLPCPSHPVVAFSPSA